nr:MAG TPA: hypothetical protein [Caudoviricetes sp.]
MGLFLLLLYLSITTISICIWYHITLLASQNKVLELPVLYCNVLSKVVIAIVQSGPCRAF